tara:strand:- start:269 stop:556 length:288 start_codon:yes stop_codon:yes gene_type:complete
MITLKIILRLEEGERDDWVKESIELSRHLNCDVKFEGELKIVTLEAESKKEIKSKIMHATASLAKKGIVQDLVSVDEVDQSVIDTLAKLKQAVTI